MPPCSTRWSGPFSFNRFKRFCNSEKLEYGWCGLFGFNRFTRFCNRFCNSEKLEYALFFKIEILEGGYFFFSRFFFSRLCRAYFFRREITALPISHHLHSPRSKSCRSLSLKPLGGGPEVRTKIFITLANI